MKKSKQCSVRQEDSKKEVNPMKLKILFSVSLFLALLLSPAAFSQKVYTQGPIWRIELIRVKPGQIDPYIKSLQQITKPLLEEEKRQNLIVDYKVFLKQTKSSPEDWDVALAVEYKDFAALDNLTEKHDAIRDKLMGGGDKTQEMINSRLGTREILSQDWLEEIFLK
jgi:hypothetical protein